MPHLGSVGAMGSWAPGQAEVVALPSGLLLRGRALRRPLPEGAAQEFGLYLQIRPPDVMPWPFRWLRWGDFRTPSDRSNAQYALREVRERAKHQRVEVAYDGGRGRTGTALACLAVLEGVPAHEAVAWTRLHYDKHAVETPWQRRYVEQFHAK